MTQKELNQYPELKEQAFAMIQKYNKERRFYKSDPYETVHMYLKDTIKILVEFAVLKQKALAVAVMQEYTGQDYEPAKALVERMEDYIQHPEHKVKGEDPDY